MANLWAIAKELKIFPTKLEELAEIPYTWSYVIRKRMQVDSINELPNDKRPPDVVIWWRPQEELERWINNALKLDDKSSDIFISESEIE
jgi:hypothetical protein